MRASRFPSVLTCVVYEHNGQGPLPCHGPGQDRHPPHRHLTPGWEQKGRNLSSGAINCTKPVWAYALPYYQVLLMILAATGHRPDKLGGYNSTLSVLRTDLIMDWMETRAVERGITGMALGWDQDFALACYELGIPYTAAVPFEGQESQWPQKSRLIYNWLMNRAADIVVVSPGAYNAGKMLARNVWMVDECTHLLALYDGTQGGTQHCLKYAREWEKPVVNLWDVYMKELDDDVPF